MDNTEQRYVDSSRQFLLSVLYLKFGRLGWKTIEQLNWEEHVNYVVTNYVKQCISWYIINRSRELAYTSPVRPILEYNSGCKDPYRGCLINVLQRIQTVAANFEAKGVVGKRLNRNKRYHKNLLRRWV